MNKAVVGITPLIDYEKGSYWMLPGYMSGISQAGGLPLMLPMTEDPEEIRQLLDLCDGILIAGGQDVSPVLYGQQEEPCCGECAPERDRMELVLLDEALSRDMPVFGICRGLQFINAALGGSLWQDLPSQRPSGVHHVMGKPYDAAQHSVTVVPGTELYRLLKENDASGREDLVIGVNSLHHQAIRELSPRLEVMAVSEDGLTESVRVPDKAFVWAVQWHPELSYKVNENSRRLFSAFIDAAEAFRNAGTGR